MAMAIRPLAAAATTLVGISFVFYIVSNAVPLWSKASFGGIESTDGLWKGCTDSSRGKLCFDIKCPSPLITSDDCNKLLASRAFVTLAGILSGISTICLVVCIVMKDKIPEKLLTAVRVLIFLCYIMGTIGVVIGIIIFYTDVKNIGLEIKVELGAAAIIGIIAIIFNFFGGIVTLFINR